MNPKLLWTGSTGTSSFLSSGFSYFSSTCYSICWAGSVYSWGFKPSMAPNPVGWAALLSSSLSLEVGYDLRFWSSCYISACSYYSGSTSGLVSGIWIGSYWASACNWFSTRCSCIYSLFYSSTSGSVAGSAFYSSWAFDGSGLVSPDETRVAVPIMASSYSSSHVNLSTSC